MFAGSLLFAIQIYNFLLRNPNRLNVRDTPRNVKMQRFAAARVRRILYYEARFAGWPSQTGQGEIEEGGRLIDVAIDPVWPFNQTARGDDLLPFLRALARGPPPWARAGAGVRVLRWWQGSGW